MPRIRPRDTGLYNARRDTGRDRQRMSVGFDRHPKIEEGVFLGAKCAILGNVTVGEGATVAAAALVNKP
eukprot:2441615-Prymnesium_polylepis.1